MTDKRIVSKERGEAVSYSFIQLSNNWYQNDLIKYINNVWLVYF
jgi:hypothetical protein